MHRLPVDTESLAGDVPSLSPGAMRHLKVIRPREGETVELFDGAGRWRRFVWSGGRLSPGGDVRMAPRPAPLVLFACVTKGSRWDWTVEKATELGATRIVPVMSERTVVRIPAAEREAKRLRWMRIAVDAARQSDAKWVPEVCAAADFADAAAMAAECECFVGALADPPHADILSAVSARPRDGRPPAVFVGPEGDFTPEELAALASAATPVSLGPAVLRAETAAIYALSVLKAVADSARR